MRKKNYLTQLNYKDECLCNLVKHSNHVSQSQALSLVTRNRISNYEKQGILKKLHYMDNNQKVIVYELTPKGRNFICKNFNHLSGNFYTAPTAILHNLTLANEVLRYSSSSNQWLNERDLREILMETILNSHNRWSLMELLDSGKISVPDGAYRDSEGTIHAIEVISENYTVAMLAAKDLFSQITNIEIEYVKQD